MGIPYRFDPMGTLGASPLPPGYARVDSVFFNGNSYIDTGITRGADDEYVFDAAFVPILERMSGAGAYPTDPIDPSCIVVTQEGELYAPKHTGTSERIPLPTGVVRYVLTRGLVYAGSYVFEVGAWDSRGDTTWRIMSFYSAWGTRDAKGRFYGGCIKRNGLEIAKYIPCKRMADSTYHVCDVLSGEVLQIYGDPLEV